MSISLLSLAMLVGCYIAGTIPLAVNFSEVSNLFKLLLMGELSGMRNCSAQIFVLLAEKNQLVHFAQSSGHSS